MIKKLIMVIDDNVTNLNIAKSILENDYDILLITDGEKAIKTITKRTPDLILLDILMPKKNGFEVIQEIQKLGSPYNAIPTIFLTSKSDDESEILGLDLGAVDYIRKPFSAPILLKRVELHLRFQNQNKELIEQKQKLSEYSSLLEENVAELKSQNSLNDTMIKCIATLVESDNIDVSMSKLLEIINDYYGAISTKIIYKVKNSGTFKNYFSFNKVDSDGNSDSDNTKMQEFPIKDAVSFFYKFEVNGIANVTSIDDVVDIPIFYKMFLENKITALLFVPLFELNEIVGFLGIQNYSQNANDLMVKNIAAFIVNHIIKHNLLHELEKLSFNDTLTGLYNRNHYNNFVDEFKIQANNKIGIIFCDINGLKVKNDNFGHEAGDKLIKDTAMFLIDNIDGLVFRIGGDEFVCFLENIENDAFDALVLDFKNKVKESENISISIGSVWDENFTDIQNIIAIADKKMYDDKNDFYSHKN